MKENDEKTFCILEMWEGRILEVQGDTILANITKPKKLIPVYRKILYTHYFDEEDQKLIKPGSTFMHYFKMVHTPTGLDIRIIYKITTPWTKEELDKAKKRAAEICELLHSENTERPQS